MNPDILRGVSVFLHEKDATMEQRPYGLRVLLDVGLSEAEDRARSALAAEGFGVLTEIDVQATLKMKIDVDRPAYKILGACSCQPRPQR